MIGLLWVTGANAAPLSTEIGAVKTARLFPGGGPGDGGGGGTGSGATLCAQHASGRRGSSGAGAAISNSPDAAHGGPLGGNEGVNLVHSKCPTRCELNSHPARPGPPGGHPYFGWSPTFAVSFSSACSTFTSRSSTFLKRTQLLPIFALGSFARYRSATQPRASAAHAYSEM